MIQTTRNRGTERGSTSVFAIIVVAVLVLLAGLCIDGGRVLNARATLVDTAEQAARAGAQQVSVTRLRSGAGVVVDPAAARAAARSYLLVVGSGAATSQVSAEGQSVTVTIEDDVPTSMLRLVGVDSVHLTVSGTARAVTGRDQEEP